MKKSSRKQLYKQRYKGATPYVVWILVGVVLGKIVKRINKDAFVMIDSDGAYIPVQKGAMESIFRQKFAYINETNSVLVLLNDGFSIAHDRLKHSNITIKNIKGAK